MSVSIRYLILTICVTVLLGCSAQKDPTPVTVEEQFVALLETLDEDCPGAAIEQLKIFLHDYDRFEIADTVQYEIKHFRSLAGNRYHDAREYARQGDFERAERVLNDLARYFPHTGDGKSARTHLEFDFYFGKAQWMLMHQQFKESAEVARELLEHDLTPMQTNQVEALLDNTSTIDAALALSERQTTRAACRHLTILLVQTFVEEGRYPAALTLEGIKQLDPYGSQSVLRALSAIENYRATDRGYSFDAVSADGRHRLHIVDGEIQE